MYPTSYHKETHKWGFMSFVTKVDDSQSFVSDYGEPVTEGIMVVNLLRGIQYPITSNSKYVVASNTTMIDGFTLDIDHFVHFIDPLSLISELFISLLIIIFKMVGVDEVETEVV